MNTIKEAKVTQCTFTSEWLNPASRKMLYYHEIILDNGDRATCGSIEKNSSRIEVGATIQYSLNNGRMTLHSSSNDKKNEEKSPAKSKIKGQEAFLGYAWSYAKDLIIAGKTMEDVDELNKVARYIYSELGKMLINE